MKTLSEDNLTMLIIITFVLVLILCAIFNY